MTTITDENIKHFVSLYLNKKRSKLPRDLRNIPIGNWVVTNVTDMSELFMDYNDFNEPLNWDVSNVTNMDYMFGSCYRFNQDLSEWDVSNVRDMSYMFLNCTLFNQDLSKWDVSNVRVMTGMFRNCINFNQDISGWDVSNVKNMSIMFENCKSFNQDLSNWDVSKVEFHDSIFKKCSISEENKPIFNDDTNYSQRKEEKETEKNAYKYIPNISQSRNLPEQISNEITSFLTKDKQSTINDKLLKTSGLTNINTRNKTVINEEPDVKMGIGGKKMRKSRKLRKKMKLRGKSRRK